ncbi:MAG: hypothetical protein JNK53_05095 [Phycisphaerae bacterium]|nr:hypothetical protein [Phycisphaerae bacterium]
MSPGASSSAASAIAPPTAAQGSGAVGHAAGQSNGARSRNRDLANGTTNQGNRSVNNSFNNDSYNNYYTNNTTNNYYGNGYNDWRGSNGWCGNGWYGNNWCGPSWYRPACYGPGWYGGSGFSLSVGWSSWSGWNFGIGFGWNSGSYCAPYYAPAYCAPVYCAPAYYSPVWCGPSWYGPSWYSPVYYGPAWYAPATVVVSSTPFYAYPQTVVVTNYVERVVEVPAPEYPNYVALDTGSSTGDGPSAYIVPTSGSMAAWSALNSGDIGRAGMAFQDLLLMDPTDGRALMGRGIAYMLEGNTGQATAAFRLAIGSDTGAINSLPISTALAERVRRQSDALWSQPDSDAAFVAAVGYAALNEPQLAFRVASRAIELGDRSLTTAQLRSQLSYAMNGG